MGNSIGGDNVGVMSSDCADCPMYSMRLGCGLASIGHLLSLREGSDSEQNLIDHGAAVLRLSLCSLAIITEILCCI